jgi:P27 family predicted phage terminase small subunit
MLSEEGRKEWRRVCKELLPLGLLTVLDRGALAAYCEAWNEFVKAQEEVNKENFKRVLISEKGGEYPNPALWVARDARKNLNQMSEKLGMTPASRARLSIGRDEDGDDEYEQYRKRGGQNPFDGSSDDELGGMGDDSGVAGVGEDDEAGDGVGTDDE